MACSYHKNALIYMVLKPTDSNCYRTPFTTLILQSDKWECCSSFSICLQWLVLIRLNTGKYWKWHENTKIGAIYFSNFTIMEETFFVTRHQEVSFRCFTTNFVLKFATGRLSITLLYCARYRYVSFD